MQSLKKEVEWDRSGGDDRSTTGESSSDYRHPHEPVSECISLYFITLNNFGLLAIHKIIKMWFTCIDRLLNKISLTFWWQSWTFKFYHTLYAESEYDLYKKKETLWNTQHFVVVVVGGGGWGCPACFKTFISIFAD